MDWRGKNPQFLAAYDRRAEQVRHRAPQVHRSAQQVHRSAQGVDPERAFVRAKRLERLEYLERIDPVGGRAWPSGIDSIICAWFNGHHPWRNAPFQKTVAGVRYNNRNRNRPVPCPRGKKNKKRTTVSPGTDQYAHRSVDAVGATGAAGLRTYEARAACRYTCQGL